MADIIGSYERLPNDAVRAVAVAKRREYPHKHSMQHVAACLLPKLLLRDSEQVLLRARGFSGNHSDSKYLCQFIHLSNCMH